MEFLAFRLFGPMASWGDTTLTRRRPTLHAPTKSAIAGLIGAALGRERDEQEGFWSKFAVSFGVAVKVDHAAKQPLGDYHTVFTYKQDEASLCATRREEIKRIRQAIKDGEWKNSLILTSRYYLLDFLATVIIWRKADDFPSLQSVSEALICPRFPLYLGRKSCPIGLPLEPQISSSESLSEAFISAEKCFKQFDWMKILQSRKAPVVYWEEGIPLGKPLSDMTIMTRMYNDVPVSRTSWTFTSRPVKYAAWPKEALP
ncbi:MAG: type I-E CRISPR-associated protein Cas5/CasD [Nitrospirae bacterium]|nr:type I-E CRISPR-associated protein Cas5/CasD [Nitrospirota bacterium]